MHLVELGLKNWKCYQGEHALRLEPKTYAVLARYESDPERSNWAGKSSLLEAIDFLLHGRLPESCEGNVDAWINRDEGAGEVSGVLSTGHRIVRTKARDKPRRIYLFDPENPTKPKMNDEAQLEIARLVGLSKEDFLNCYFAQGQLASFVTAKPEEREEAIASWYRLGALEECEELAGAELGRLLGEQEKAISTAASWRLQADRAALVRDGDPPAVEKLKAQIAAIEAEVAEIEADVRRTYGAAEKAREEGRLVNAAIDYDRIVERGKELAASRPPAPAGDVVPLREKLNEAAAKARVAAADAEAKRRLVSGEFDGACPLVGEACPARSFVLDGKRRNAANAIAAGQAAIAAVALRDAAEAELAAHESATIARERHDARLRELRAQAMALKPQKDAWLAVRGTVEAGAFEAHARAENAYFEARNRLSGARAMLKVVEDALREAEAWEARAAELEPQIAAQREAAAVFEKAARRIAERNTREIEARARSMLARCGIDLSLEAVWSRDGKKPARACGACGAGFPASAKVKQCSKCGAARGRQPDNKFRLALTARSGAADGIAGFFFRFAASAWLRRDRGSSWSLALIDEPFGMMDRPNRVALAGHLVGMLASEHGFRQAMVIAHDASILDAMPGRIEVESDGRRANVKVIA